MKQQLLLTIRNRRLGMSMSKFKLATATAIISSAFMIMPVGAKQVWDMPNEYNDNSLPAKAQIAFGDVIEKDTDGEIVIQNQFGGAMGYRSQDQFDMVASGAIPIANSNITTLGGINPYFLLSSLPFLANSTDEAHKLWEISKPYYDEIFEQNNQILLYATPWTPAGLWSKKPVNNKEDFESLKIRTWDATGTETLINADANAVQLNWGDVVPQLAAGGINAVLTSSEGGANAKFWEHLKNFTPLNYSMSLNVTHINKDVYDSLTDEQKEIIKKASEKAEEVSWTGVVKLQDDNFVEMKEHGVSIADAAPDDVMETLREAAVPIIDNWMAKSGDAGKETIETYYKAVGRD